jgi:hypothetical protein
MLDFNNLYYFPSLFEDLSYTIINETKFHYSNNYFNFSYYDPTPNSFKGISISPRSLSSMDLTTDVPSDVTKQVIPYTESYNKATSPKSYASDSASSTFSKYFFYQDQALASTPINNPSLPGTKIDSALPIQPELPEETQRERTALKKAVRFDSSDFDPRFELDPEIPERKTNIEPLYPYEDYSALSPYGFDYNVPAPSKPFSILKHDDRLSLDIEVPMVKEESFNTLSPYSDDKDYLHTKRYSDISNSVKVDNVSSLHKLNTNLEAANNPMSLHDELFKKKVLFEENNNRVSELEIHNINLDYRIATIEKESSNLVKQKLEYTKQFNINNIKNVQQIPSSIFEKYRDSYLSITNSNKEISLNIRNIKDKLDFLEKTKLNILKDINNNIKNIASLKNGQTLLAKEIHDIEKITGNITRTPLN